ncbi:MAG: tRNA-dihydrouridine synthase family protein [Treponema sp.]|jgi:tRNA-dihydrouridine synthase|nr:tRNA-dihydrouridine synthase family protein [Treponema sp.]
MKPLLLAPMAELSHRALRELIESFGGCDEYFTGMISAGALFGGGPFEKWYLDAGPCPKKTVYQLVGADMEQLARATVLLDGRECAGIDINMGCSAPLIRKTGAGVAWMADIDRAGKLIARLRPLTRRRLSVKLRTGFNDDFDYLLRFCRRLEAEGLDLVTLHPRNASEKFKRRARWDYVGRLKQELSIPVVGNGDIDSAEALAEKAGPQGSPCDAVMPGRAAVQKPWIFAHAQALAAPSIPLDPRPGTFHRTNEPERRFPSGGTHTKTFDDAKSFIVPDLEETALRFLEFLVRHQPPEFHISRARRFFSFFCKNFKWGTWLANSLNREESLSGMERVLREYCRENEED